MYEIDGTKITMTRGDTVRIRFPLELDGEDYELQEGDSVRFAINTSEHEDEPILEKALDGYDLVLDPADTKGLDFGTYFYDVQITFAASGDVVTYIAKGRLKLTWEAD